MQTIEKDEFLNVVLQELTNQKDTTFSVVKKVFNRNNFSKKQRNLTHTNTHIYTLTHTHTDIHRDRHRHAHSNK